MKFPSIVLMLPGILIMPGLVAPTQSRVIQAEWEYQHNESLAGFRLYYENNPVCESTDPTASSMNCSVEAPDGEARFTLTAFFQDDTESPHSSPFFYIFSSSLKAIFNADVLEGESPLPVSFDATPSTGNIVSYDWLFGDGQTGNGNLVNHIFTTAGNYTVKLKVNDDTGAFDQETASIVVTTPSVANMPPHAVLSSSMTVGNAPLQVQFDGSGSTDSDGSIISYTWAMGDGGTANGPQATYTYLTPGNYTATLTVTDEGGLSDSVSTPVLVGTSTDVGDNKLPIALITANKDSGPAPLSVSFDGSQSNDPDGSIAKYEWNFGDGSSATGVSPQHTFAKPAVYTVTLKVTDNKGGQSKLAKFNVRVMKPGTVVETTPDKPSKVLPYVINLLLNKPPLSSLKTNNEADQEEETESPGEQN
jgi:PKD repeat protein